MFNKIKCLVLYYFSYITMKFHFRANSLTSYNMQMILLYHINVNIFSKIINMNIIFNLKHKLANRSDVIG